MDPPQDTAETISTSVKICLRNSKNAGKREEKGIKERETAEETTKSEKEAPSEGTAAHGGLTLKQRRVKTREWQKETSTT